MKKFFRFLVLGILAVAFTVAAVSPSFAQDEDKRKLYDAYINNYQGDEAKQKIALEAAKEYVAKFGTNDADKEQVEYFKSAIPTIEANLKKMEDDRIAREKAKAQKEKEDALFKRLNTAAENKQVADAYAAGKEILTLKPNYLDLYIILATMGYDEAVKKNNQFNNDAIEYAKKSIQLIDAGETSKGYGAQFKANNYSYGSKENALGWLNYNIGYILYFPEDKKAEALPYLYKSIQYNSDVKGFSDAYMMLGDYYIVKVAELDKKRKDVITANNNEDNDESLSILAMEKAYADRAIDYLAKAYKIATGPKSPATNEFKQSLYTRLKNVYDFRYGNTDGLDAYVASAMSKPLVNPSAEVQPVVEETQTETATETTTSTTETTKPNMGESTDKKKTDAKTTDMTNQKPAPKKPSNR